MSTRLTARTLVSVLIALCVATTFAGSAAAAGLDDATDVTDDLGDTDDLTDGIGDGVNVTDEVPEVEEPEIGGDGGGGDGSVSVESDQGSVAGGGEVSASQDGVSVGVDGEGAANGESVSGGVECDVSPDSAQNPQDACETDAPGGGEAPELPDDEVPELPGNDAPTTPGLDGLEELLAA
ncbi:hypothetical protein [Natronomonas amylolytica]|uniref:hypothetical protein n=1 Tax=Natronomonas amylolytica TaxID=3108498 RepID=UPI00300866EC